MPQVRAVHGWRAAGEKRLGRATGNGSQPGGKAYGFKASWESVPGLQELRIPACLLLLVKDQTAHANFRSVGRSVSFRK